MIVRDVEQIWSDFLTKPEEYKEGERFAFIVYACSSGIMTEEEERNQRAKAKKGDKIGTGECTEIFMVKGKNNKKIPVKELFAIDEQGREKIQPEANRRGYKSLMFNPSLGTVVPLRNKNHNAILEK